MDIFDLFCFANVFESSKLPCTNYAENEVNPKRARDAQKEPEEVYNIYGMKCEEHVGVMEILEVQYISV